MEQIFGKGVSKGVAAGPISFYRRASGVIPRHEVSDTAAELERFRAARETAKEQLAKLYDKALTEAGEDAAMLFEAHQMMLDDLDFVESIEGLIENDRLNAEPPSATPAHSSRRCLPRWTTATCRRVQRISAIFPRG